MAKITTFEYNKRREEEENVIAPRNIGEVVASTIPLVDSGLHLLDGALLNGSGVYGEFVSYMAELYGDGSNIPSYFTTETNWQSEIALNGVCGKFVYDSVNNTLRLPKYGNQIYTTDFESFDIPVLGNGYALGLTEGTHTGYLNSASNGIAQISSRNQATPQTTGSAVINAGGTFNFLNVGVIEDAEWSGLKGVVDLSQTADQDIYYYIVVSNKSSKSALQIDIDEITTDLNGKADRDGSNMASSVKNFDGGFTQSYVAIADHVSMPTSSAENITLDLSSYLPDDNYNYEVLFTSFISTLGTATKQYCAVCLTTEFVHKAFLCACESSASSISAKGGGSALIPVGVNREVTIVSDSYSGYTSGGTITLRALAYRRLGTNS